MIAVVFIGVLLAVAVGLAFNGAATDLPISEILVLCGLFAAFFGAGVYIAATLGILGLLAGLAFSSRPFWLFLGEIAWTTTTNYVLIAMPLFLLMGEILLRAGISDRLYKALGLWMNRVPGGLLHTNIMSCALFSAISGSSIATAATMGSVALPYFEKTNYDRRMVLGSLAAGGALGNLIPPGITFIIYALLTNTSVGKLYLAAVGPGLLVTVLFLAYIFVKGLRGPRMDAPKVPLLVKLLGLVDLVPTLALGLVVLGSMYGGLATPTEAAALGAVAAVVFAALAGKFNLRMLHESALATARNTALVGLILISAFLLNYVLTSLDVPRLVAGFVTGLPLPAWALMAMIIGLYFALGTFMEGFSMIITTIPVVFPIVTALGYDAVWFGVIVTMLIEIALITPPDGTVMYVLQGLRRPSGPITDIFAGVTPFVALYVAAVVLLVVFPSIALWLPSLQD
ncbi:TRAP transporter large permease [Humitalea sp. 24SJ18S-53]|uniref:TRAP transporter large permease n=1 Tax=Humitalea sp. 24SJ18S-53 TaxID=3422307 RepID=UPI003D67823F